MDTTTTTDTCAACKSWKESGNGQGECRARSPQLIVFEVDNDTKIESRFPTTSASDWCGEFQAK